MGLGLGLGVGDGVGLGVGVGDGVGLGVGEGDGLGVGVGVAMPAETLLLAELLPVFGSVTCSSSSSVTVDEPVNECAPPAVQITDHVKLTGSAVLTTSDVFCWS